MPILKTKGDIMEQTITSPEKQSLIYSEILHMIHNNECPKCFTFVEEVLVYIDGSDIVESCEYICKKCGYSIGFGSSQE